MFSSSDLLTDDQQMQGEQMNALRAPEGDLHILFSIPCGISLALPAIGVREVISLGPDRITPVPNTSPLLLGILNLRGQVIWVADTGQFLGDETPLNTDRAEISVIAIEDEEMMVGLAVDEVKGMEWLDSDQVRPSSNLNDKMAPFIRGEWVLDIEEKETLKLLDPITILRSARWGA